MPSPLSAIRSIVSRLKLDESLFFLNYLLGVSRGAYHDDELARTISASPIPPMPFLVHFFAKQLLQNASVLGIETLDWRVFQRLRDLYFELGDPIIDDPTWLQSDPTGFVERFMGAQLPAQRQIDIQNSGIALGIFRDAARKLPSNQFDLPGYIKQCLGMKPEEFMQMGFLCSSLREASYHGRSCRGTFTHMHLANAYAHNLVFSSPEIWQPFFSRVSCDPQQFREISQRAEYRVEDERYVQYEFNALHRYPVTHVGGGRYIAVDPHLLLQRTTQGMFYDMFENSRLEFTQRFGDLFALFVGELLNSVCHREELWCEEKWKLTVNNREMGRLGKRGDWAFRGQSHLVLFECKSFRPTLDLLTYGRQEAVEKMYQRLESALLQVVEHSSRIQQGDWARHAIPPANIICVVVTFGRLSSANGSIVRKRLLERLQSHGRPIPPFLILSITDLDSVVRLVEHGDPLDSVLYRMVQSLPSFDVLQVCQDEIRERAVSHFVDAIGSKFLHSITDIHGHAQDI